MADRDDALLEKVLDDVKPTPEELYRDMRKDLRDGSVIEVLVGAAEHASGVRRLWKALRHDAPAPAETAQRRQLAPGGAARAQVFKTHYAGHAGKLSFARIWSGTIADGAQLGVGREAGRDHCVRASGRRADRRHVVARRAAGGAAVPTALATGLCDGGFHD